MALTKFCNAPGCKRLCSIGEHYCPEHAAVMIHQEAERQAKYDKSVRAGRDAQYTAFYHSGLWEAKRLYIINLYSGLDIYAYYVRHKAVPATMVHHIVELKEDPSLRLVDSNLIPLSDASHRKMDQLYKKDKASTQDMLRGLLVRWHEEYMGGQKIEFKREKKRQTALVAKSRCSRRHRSNRIIQGSA